MIFIAHRGNMKGPSPHEENRPDIIDKTYHQYGFHSEVDLWRIGDTFWLGHDEPQYDVDLGWLKTRMNLLWIHCKNIEAMIGLKYTGMDFNYFWHEEDAYTLTSKGYIWAYPGKRVPTKCNAIAVMPEAVDMPISDLKQFRGVCTDFGINYI